MPKRFLYLLPLLLVALAAPIAVALAPEPAPQVARAPAGKHLEGLVVSNHDGDTLTLKLDSGKVEKVRLLGIDTAEMAQGRWGARARDFLARLVKNRRVKVVFDVQERDRYGRLLGYVYTQDGTFVNLELVRQGYAMVLTYPPNVAHVEAFTAAQHQARAKRLNIWGPEGLEQSPRDFRRHGATRGEGLKLATPKPAVQAGQVSMNTKSKKYHRPDCHNADCKACEPMSEAEARDRGGSPAGCCH